MDPLWRIINQQLISIHSIFTSKNLPPERVSTSSAAVRAAVKVEKPSVELTTPAKVGARPAWTV